MIAVCVYSCIYAYLCMSMCICVFLCLWICLFMYICVFVSAYRVCVYMHVYMYIWFFVWLFTCCMCVCMSVYVLVCICVCFLRHYLHMSVYIVLKNRNSCLLLHAAFWTYGSVSCWGSACWYIWHCQLPQITGFVFLSWALLGMGVAGVQGGARRWEARALQQGSPADTC